MRRHDREITERREIDAILSRETICRIAFAVESEPYLVPLSYGYDIDGGALILHTATAGKKIDCIAANPRVCFEVEGPSEVTRGDERGCAWSLHFESVIGLGTIREVREPDDKRSALIHLMRQQSGTVQEWTFDDENLKVTRVWRLKIESATGKRSG